MTAPTPTRPPQPFSGRSAGPRRAGAAVLELAITLAVLLGLTFGTVEFGYFFFVKNTVQGAAREGARAGILPGGSNTDVNDAVNRVLTSAGLTPAHYSVTVKVNGAVVDASTATAGQQVEVTVTAPWGVVGMRPLGAISAGKTVLGAATMRRESI